MKIKILKQTFVKGEFAEAGKVVEASEQDSQILIGSGHGIAVAEDMKKPENKAVKKKSIFSRKKK
jgi:methionyl-tRNA formyltransferase